MIILGKLAEQTNNQRVLKIKTRFLNETHDMKLAEALAPITKKLEEVNQSTEKLSDLIKKSNSENENNQEVVPVEIESEDEKIRSNPRALPNSSKFSATMTETLGALMNSKNCLKLKQYVSGRA